MGNCASGCKFCCLLVVVGAINWGLVGVGHFLGTDLNVVNMLLGSWPAVENIVYVLVGVAGVMTVAKGGGSCKA